MTPGRSADTADTRDRILRTAATLLGVGGPDAVSIRAVSASAGVQAPTIYRLFGNKQGLLDAVVTHGFTTQLRHHTIEPTPADPVDDLRRGWDAHIAYALANPHLYRMTYVDPAPEPDEGAPPTPADVATDVLRRRIRRIASAGRLRVGERRAVHLVQAGGVGTALTLLSMSEERRDLSLSDVARETVIATITTDTAAPADDTGPVSAALRLRAVLDDVEVLNPSERALLADWLDRIAAPGEHDPASRGPQPGDDVTG